ncbi:replication initiation factor domain-containing protein [Paenibacillus foliorum]|uniref:replication initiation factor domain-containing protein n=1 Tax=Paenibacillus foliorum TaxID=2654974 RepID=UPI001FE79A32|nr:replication initiation factor domain-containing protein [Paenibacillus foliorum]
MLGAKYNRRRLRALLLKGFDTLEFGLDFENYNSSFESFILEFRKLKDFAQMMGIEQSVPLGDMLLTVHRNGQRFYAYKLSCKDFSIAFAESEMKSNSPIFVRFMSSYIWSYGHKKAYDHFMNWFKCFGVKPISNRLSRADICADTDQFQFIQNDVKGVVTRAKSKTEHFVNEEYTNGRKFSGFTVGRGNPMMARIYNKSLEIKKSGKTWFNDVWNENDWNSKNEVWRVEFQLRREVLKELTIDNIEQLFKKIDELWVYLTVDWLTIRQPSSDNVSRWKIKRKWKHIQKADLAYEPTPLIRESVKQGNLKQLLDQAAGLMMSVASISDHESITNTSDVIKSWFEVNLLKKNTTFEVEKDRRKTRFLHPDTTSADD